MMERMMDNYVREKKKELAETKARLEQLKQQYELYKAQEDINLLVVVFPKLSENMRMVRFCRGIGLAIETIKELFTGKEVTINGKLHSSEHEKYFDVKDAKLQLYKEKNNPDKLHLSPNGQNILSWFRQKYQEIKHATNHYTRRNIKPEIDKNKGFKR